MEQKQSIHDLPVFKNLSASELRLISEVARTKRYRKGQTIFLEGEPFAGLYAVLGGGVELYRVDKSGGEVLLQEVESGGVFAESSFKSGSDFYLSCAKAFYDSTLLFFPIDEFASLMRNNPALAIRLSEAFSVDLMQLNLKFDLLAATVDARVARYLLNEIQLNESVRLPEPHFNLTLRKKEIAVQLGMATESLSRALGKLKREKVIRQVAKKIFVTDLKRLRDLGQE